MNRVPVKTTAMSNLRRFSRSLAVAALILLPFAAVQAEDTVEPSGYTPIMADEIGADLFGDRHEIEDALAGALPRIGGLGQG